MVEEQDLPAFQDMRKKAMVGRAAKTALKEEWRAMGLSVNAGRRGAASSSDTRFKNGHGANMNKRGARYPSGAFARRRSGFTPTMWRWQVFYPGVASRLSSWRFYGRAFELRMLLERSWREVLLRRGLTEGGFPIQGVFEPAAARLASGEPSSLRSSRGL